MRLTAAAVAAFTLYSVAASAQVTPAQGYTPPDDTPSIRLGTTIFAKGDPGTSLFAVCSGTVKISNHSTDGKDAVFNLINVGEIFGEIALLDGQPRTAEAIALSDCELMVIDRRDFVPLIKSEPEIATVDEP